MTSQGKLFFRDGCKGKVSLQADARGVALASSSLQPGVLVR